MINFPLLPRFIVNGEDKALILSTYNPFIKHNLERALCGSYFSLGSYSRFGLRNTILKILRVEKAYQISLHVAGENYF
ncbi:hypothetical protein MMG00_05900 [Ignatzschineria rhizosphaerae]|uniref:Uncharacterized protein n=1 Tax=Ignatzschineria rhizosphaerae TaxID=2923279 RepID=A0ABY3X3B7_9GAMM|nr:hypothetical protein [Ignatzschineria rhizosphaerae]UNM97378.1 hypothetical protein MMG00_05900 [Ignatzschineria rhizosphaerae]